MSEVVEAGLTITLIGMSTVFVLLGLLVWIVQLLARFDPMIGATGKDGQSTDEAELMSVIGAAVRMFRSQHGATRRRR